MHFGERLRILRKDKNISQTELGKELGLHYLQICRYEKGLSHPSAKILKKLAKIFDISIDYLLQGETEKIIDSLGTGKLLFNSSQNHGILPFNFSRNNEGLARKGQFVCLGENNDHVQEILNQAVELLPSKGTFDHD